MLKEYTKEMHGVIYDFHQFNEQTGQRIQSQKGTYMILHAAQCTTKFLAACRRMFLCHPMDIKGTKKIIMADVPACKDRSCLHVAPVSCRTLMPPHIYGFMFTIALSLSFCVNMTYPWASRNPVASFRSTLGVLLANS